MARRRLEDVEETGAEVVLTECNSCVHNLSNAKLRKQKFRICTTTQFINELMEEAELMWRRIKSTPPIGRSGGWSENA